MKKTVLGLVLSHLLLALSSCSEEGRIGGERCLGANTRCEPAPPETGSYDLSAAKPVSSEALRAAKLLWSIDLDCEGRCGGFDQLTGDGQGGVWIVHMAGGIGTLGSSARGLGYERVDAQGSVVAAEDEAPSSDQQFTVDFTFQIQRCPDGALMMPRTSRVLDLSEPWPYLHRITRIGQDGFSDLIVGRSREVSGNGLLRAEQSFDAIASEDGFITVMLAPKMRVVREIDEAGGTLWRQVELPKESQIVVRPIPLDSGFALLTVSDVRETGATIHKLLWFDRHGNVTAHVRPPIGGMNLQQTALPLSNARVALAGTTLAERVNTLRPGQAVADLYVSRLAPNGTLSGHRIIATGLSPPSLLGMTADADDTIYLSSVSGTRAHPQGLICALPDQAAGTCYLAPEGVFPTAISPATPGVLYALSERRLVKLELPPIGPSIE